MINIVHGNNNTISIDKSEVCRYLGYNSSDAAAHLDGKINSIITKVSQVMTCKACYDIFPVSTDCNGILNLSFMTTDSKQLAKMLCNCREIVLFTATIGIEIDRMISKASRLSPTDALILQAAGAAAIESWCDAFCYDLKLNYEKVGKYLTPRFSPGYGDFPLSAQQKIFRVLDCPKKIGVSLTDSLMMIPTKSVSAIIGISDKNTSFAANECALCNNTECKFRKK